MLLGLQRAAVLSGGGPLTDSDALLWKAAVVAAGGTVSDARLALISAYISSLKPTPWNLLDRQWLLAAENSQSALIDLVARASATAVNSPTFTVDRDYTFNGSTNYINTNYTASTDKVALSLNSGHLSTYTRVVTTSSVFGGKSLPGDGLDLFAPLSDGKMYARINNNDTGGGDGAALGPGFFIGDRPNATSVVNSRNGVDVGTDVMASTVVVSVPLYIGALNTNNSPTAFGSSRIAAVSVGGSLGSSGRSAFYAAIQSYMTSLGAQV